MTVLRSVDSKLNNVIDELAANPALFLTQQNAFTRERVLGFKTTVKTILSMQGKTLDKEMIDAGLSATASAFVQRRKLLLPDLFNYIFHEFTAMLPAEKRYKGYRLLAVDGTDVNTPYNKNSEFYHEGPIQHGQETKGHNSVHLNCLYDLSNKLYIDASLGGDERRQVAEMVDRYHGNRAILIADRGYTSYNMIEHIRRNPDLDYVIRAPHSSTFREINELPFEEVDIDVSINVSTKSQQFCKIYGYRKLQGEPKPGYQRKQKPTWDFEP